MAFDVVAARNEGYSDAEIADYLAGQKKFDANGARKEGYSDTEIISHLSIEPEKGYDVVGGLKTLGGSLLRVPENIVASGIEAIEGQSGASVVDNKGFADNFVNWVQGRNKKRQEEIKTEYGEREMLPGIKVTDAGDMAQNLGYSGVGIATGLVTGVGTGLVTKNPVAAWTAGGAASGAAAYRVASHQFTEQYLQMKNEEKLQSTGKPLTKKEEDDLKTDFSDKATKYGLWEAVPEAIGNVGGLKVLVTPLKKMVGKSAATRLLSKVAGLYGTELGTETVTQMGQQQTESEAKMTKEASRSWTAPTDWWESAKEVFPGVFLQTTLMAGVGGGASIIKGKHGQRRTSLSIQDAVKNNEYQNLSDEDLASTLKGATELLEKRKFDKGLEKAIGTLQQEATNRQTAAQQQTEPAATATPETAAPEAIAPENIVVPPTATVEAKAIPTPVNETMAPEAIAPQGETSPTNYEEIIQANAAKYKVDPALIKAVIQSESGFKNGLTSPAGAQGLMQLMPGTAKSLGVANVMDPAQNIEGGTKYLAALLHKFDGDEAKALSAYNWGPGNLIKHGLEKAPKETRDYLTKVQAAKAQFGGSRKTLREELITLGVPVVDTFKADVQSGKVSVGEAIEERNRIARVNPETTDEMNKTILEAQAAKPLIGEEQEETPAPVISKTEITEPTTEPRPDSISALKQDMAAVKQRREAASNEALQTETEIEQPQPEQSKKTYTAVKGNSVFKSVLPENVENLRSMGYKITENAPEAKAEPTNLSGQPEIVQPAPSSQEAAGKGVDKGFAELSANNGVTLSLDKAETAKMQGYEDTDGMRQYNVYSDGKNVGYITATEGKNDPGTLYIHGVAIDEKYQRQGIGTKALAELQKQTNTKDIIQTTDLTNAGKNFFKKYSEASKLPAPLPEKSGEAKSGESFPVVKESFATEPESQAPTAQAAGTGAPDATKMVEKEGKKDTLLNKEPPGGWTEADKVPDKYRKKPATEKKTEEPITLAGKYDTAGATAKDEHENGNLAPERKFKKDLNRYAGRLQDVLKYVPDIVMKGGRHKDTTVSTNIAPAGGDGHILLWKPNSEYGIYISVSVQRDYNDDSLKIGGIVNGIMYRAASKKDKHGLTGPNRWAAVNISAEDLAEKIRSEVDFYEQVKGAKEIIQEARNEGNTETAISNAFAEGEAIGEAEGTNLTDEENEEKIDEAAAELGVEVQEIKKTTPIDNAEGRIKESPVSQLADFVKNKLQGNVPFDSNNLFRTADAIYGGTQANGAYTSKDAYDAMELGVNKFIEAENITPDVNTEEAEKSVQLLKDKIKLLPTQTKRTKEQDEYQQFSTPPPLSFVANWVANIEKGDQYLEPSAGIGGIAVFGKIAGANVTVNELSSRRAEVLKEMGFDRLFTENAEQLNNILPADVKPSVIVMNPPFSATAGRVSKTNSMNGAAHLEQALKRLDNGGRLVTIVGEGMADDRPAFTAWWNKIKKQYNVRANIGINGNEYKKYGTTFDNQIIVIDKTGPTTGDVLTGKVDKIEDLIDLLKGVRNARTYTRKQPETESNSKENVATGEGNTRSELSLLPSTGKMGDREQQVSDGTRANGADQFNAGVEATENNGVHRASEREQGQNKAGRRETEAGRSGVEDSGRDRGQISDADRVQQTEANVKVESKKATINKAELSDSVYESYTPAKLSIAGAKKHPGNLVESAAMGAVFPPDISYQPNIPANTVKEGKLSDAQLEAIVYAGQAHSQFLSGGEVRRGYFIGDGTGVGKGREISGIILDNWNSGRKKAVWISQNSPLINDARRDAEGVGLGEDKIFDFGKIKAGKSVAQKEGVAFLGYDTLRAKGKDGSSRLQQLVDWFGKDYDGVIVFDEAHNMGNAVTVKKARGTSKPSMKALSGVELQALLPKARIVYVSATGATEVMNLAYADRLGLWGEGTPFANKADFIEKISAGGIAAMELVARDMKSMGNYLARSLSYEDVKYEKLEHTLSSDQRAIYDELAGAWQLVLSNINQALEATGGAQNGAAKSAALSQFWGSHQRFFNQIITSMQTPTVIKTIENDIKNGHSAIIQLVNTNEAAQERALSRMEEGDELEDLDMTPREQLMEYVRNGFPVAQYEEREDENGNTIMVPVKDSNGNPVENADAVALREELLDKLGGIRVPDGPLEMLLNHFGVEDVAEVTGRNRRVVEVTDEKGRHRVVEKRSKAKAMVDADAFMNDKKHILVFSNAGGTGRSYHADLTAKNQRLRRHYLLQAGWRADAAIQGFGRSHRSNQKQAPEYLLVTTDVIGQKRFISSIARRLDQLGALTKGQRETGSGGFFTARDNLESEYAQRALISLVEDIYRRQIPGMNISEFAQQTGLRLINEKDGSLNETAIPPIPTFLNRLLSMKLDYQQEVFDHFSERLDRNIRSAMENGTLDVGLETLRAKKVEKAQEQNVYNDPSGAETKYVELKITNDARIVDFDAANGAPISRGGFFQNIKSGKVWAASDVRTYTNSATGEIDQYRNVTGPAMTKRKVSLKNFSKYKELSENDARKLWDAEYNELPKEVTYSEHLITGTLLPIWDRLPHGHARIMRVQTADGERMIGRLIDPAQLQNTLNNLGASTTTAKVTPTEIFNGVKFNGFQYELANGWKIVRRKVSGEQRIELIGADFRFQQELVKYGAFSERINWQTRLFIPTSQEGISAIERITSNRPVVNVIAPTSIRENMGDDTGEDAQYSRQSIPARGITTRQVNSVVDKVKSFLKAAPNINVVQHISECPQAVIRNMEENGILDENGDADVQGFSWNGQVWLVGDNIDTPQEAVKILMHELTHDGLGKFFSTNTPNIKLRSIRLEYKSLMDAIYKAHAREVKKIARTTHTHLDVSTPVGKRQAAEEWLCNQSYQSQPKWYDKLVTLFHDVVRAIGFDVKLSDSEVRTVLRDAFSTFKYVTREKTETSIEAIEEELPVAASRKGSDITKTPEFKKWFGDSKVADEAGKPLVVYHGTNADFSTFKTRRSKTDNRLGAYFTESEEAAWQVHGGTKIVIPTYLSVKNPLDLRNIPRDGIAKAIGLDEQVQREMQTQGRAGAYKTIEWLDKKYDVIPKLKKKGFDGVVFDGDHEGITWVVFSPTQIKSAIGNNGEFNPENPDIRYQRSGETQTEDLSALIDKIIADEIAAMEAVNPETKESRLAVRLEKEAIAKELATDFGELAEYKTMNMQEQADLAQDIMNNDYDAALRMAMGEIQPPANVREATMFEAVKVRALNEGDSETLRLLATESTIPTILSQYGQAIKAADSYLIADPVKAMQTVIKHRIEETKKTKGTKAQQAEELATLRKKLEIAEKKLADYQAKKEEQAAGEVIEEMIKKPARKKAVYGQKNKIVSIDEYQKLREKLRSQAKGTQLNALPDPTMLPDLVKIGVFHLEAGIRNMAEWAQHMTEDVGDWIKPHAQEIFDESLKSYHEGVIQGIQEDIRQAVTEDSFGNIGKYAKDLAKHFISLGITEREELFNKIHDVLKAEMPDHTRRDTMKAISGYGEFKPLDPDVILTKFRDFKGQILQIAKYEDLIATGRAEKTGFERQSPSDEERRLAKLVEDAKRKYGIETVDKDRLLKSALDAVKTRLKNQIKDLEYQIETRKKIVPVKHDIKRDAEARALEKRRDELKADFEAIFGKTHITDEQRLNAALKITEKSIAEYYRRIKEGDLSGMTATSTPLKSALLDMMRGRREELRQEYKHLKDLANPKKTPEEIALRSLKTRLRNEAKKYSEMLDNLNFEPKPKRERNIDAEGQKLQDERDRIKKNYQEASKISGITSEEAANIVRFSKTVAETKAKLEAGGNRFEYGAARVAFEKYIEHLKGRDDTISHMARRRADEFKTTYQDHKAKAVYDVIKDSIQTISDTSISLVASLDNSFIGRQGLKVLMTHPTVWWPAARESFRDIRKVLGGQDAHAALMADIYSRPNCLNGAYDAAKLIPKTEEQFPTSMPERVPYAGRMFKASQTAFEGAAIRMRTDLYDLLSKTAEEAGQNVTDKIWIEDVGRVINSLTARGAWGKRGEPAIVRVILWAPKMLKANLDVLTAHGAGAGLETGFARKEAALNLLKIVGSTAVLLAMAAAMGADVEDDPRSTDFGKIKVGDTRFDVTGGAASIITLAARLLSGSYKSASTGLVHNYGTKFAARTRWDAFIDFLTNKTSPPARVVVDMLKGKNWKGEPFTWSGAAYQALTPISVQNAIKLKDEASADRVLGVIADFVGMNTQSFTASEKTWDEEQSKEMKQFHDRLGADKFKEANKKYNDRVNSWYDKAKNNPYFQKLTDDQKSEEWRKERAKAKKAVFREYRFWPKREK